MGWLGERAEYRETLEKARQLGAVWHDTNTVLPSSGNPTVFFTIPLISRARASDWDRILVNLQQTVASLRAQTDPGWVAVICSQDRPEPIDFDDRVTFLKFDRHDFVTEDTLMKFDNHAKRRMMARYLSETYPRDGYIFPLDADDVLHPDLVAHIRRDDNGMGYMIDSGYMWDVQSGDVAPLRPGRTARFGGIRAFNRECGSCLAKRVDFRGGPAYLELLHASPRHKWAHDVSEALGFPMASVPFPAALYAVNHGENMRQRRGKLGAKLRYLARHKLPPEKAARVRSIFGVGKSAA